MKSSTCAHINTDNSVLCFPRQLLVDLLHPEGGLGDTGLEGVLLLLVLEYDLDLEEYEAVRGREDAT